MLLERDNREWGVLVGPAEFLESQAPPSKVAGVLFQRDCRANFDASSRCRVVLLFLMLLLFIVGVVSVGADADLGRRHPQLLWLCLLLLLLLLLLLSLLEVVVLTGTVGVLVRDPVVVHAVAAGASTARTTSLSSSCESRLIQDRPEWTVGSPPRLGRGVPPPPERLLPCEPPLLLRPEGDGERLEPTRNDDDDVDDEAIPKDADM
jgi:hypothetical protein